MAHFSELWTTVTVKEAMVGIYDEKRDRSQYFSIEAVPIYSTPSLRDMCGAATP